MLMLTTNTSATIDYSKDIEFLNELISKVQSNVQFTITAVIAVLAVAIAIAGVALFEQAKKWVKKSVDSEFEELKNKIENLETEHIIIKSNLQSYQNVLDYIYEKSDNFVFDEKGIWTPTLNGHPNYVNQSGIYYKIGNMVVAWFDVTVIEPDKSLDHNLQITINGLPWLPSEDSFGDVNLINSYDSEHPLGLNLKANIKRNDTRIRLVNPKTHYKIFPEGGTSSRFKLTGLLIYMTDELSRHHAIRLMKD